MNTTDTTSTTDASPAAPSLRRRLGSRWWQGGAVVIAFAAALVAIDIIANDPGPMWKRLIGFTVLTTAAVLVAAGLVVRRHHRRTGSMMIAVGVTPGIVPIIFFWFPPGVAFGLFSIAVLVFAVNDAGTSAGPTVVH